MVEPHVAIGGAEAAPRRIATAEQALAGRTPDTAAFQAAADATAAAVRPLDDANISADYRRDLAGALVRRALEQAA
jgi:carbon-monoxide dehydrogenase medium subunit